MPIRAIVNGYYRTGTTAIWYAIKKSKRDAIVLYEPLHPEIHDRLSKWEIGKKDDLHSLPIWDDYFKLPRDILEEFLEKHPRKHVYFNAKEVIRLLEIINDVDQDVYLQPNRMHFVLSEVAHEFDATAYHVIRDPACVWVDHFPPDRRKDYVLLLSNVEDYNYDSAFYLISTFNAIKEALKLDVKVNRPLDMFAINYSLANYYALLDDDVIAIIFENFVHAPISSSVMFRKIINVKGIDHVRADFVNVADSRVRAEVYDTIKKLVPMRYLYWMSVYDVEVMMSWMG